MNFKITVEKLHDKNKLEDEYISDPLKALDIVELLRLQSGKFLYEYPARLRRTVEVIRRK